MKFVLIADEGERLSESFFPFIKVVVFVLLVTLILVALFPRHLLMKTLSYQDDASPAIMNYLKSFKSLYPDNKEIVLALIEQESLLGQDKSAEINLANFQKSELHPSQELIDEYQWLNYLILRTKFYKAEQGSPDYIRYLKLLKEQVKSLSNVTLSSKRMEILAAGSLAYNQANIAMKIYNKLFNMNALQTPQELAQGGSIAMQNNAHKDSAKFYWAAYEKATTVDEKHMYALQAIKVLWAGNYVTDALALATQLPDNVINDRETLLYLTRLALAANRPDIAQHYILQLLLLNKQ